ncbi:MAG: ABC transporter permease [Nitrospira sp.]|nr:ABC transporter permease [Nitrospira sp.]MDE0404550.1 ABC transporter permease [Nitrospira sp.]MDE0487212.1 ABC transporter permease [Nitrospira sp.]
MALPLYATPGQRIWHYLYLTVCALVLFFLVSPLIVVIPLSFNSAPFLHFTPEMLTLDPDGYSTVWYKSLFGMCDAEGASLWTSCTDKWKVGAFNSFMIAVMSTMLATTLGTLAALGLSRDHVPFRRAIMGLMISPLIVPLIITASGMFFFFAKVNLVSTLPGIVLAHTILGLPFVVITVTSTLVGFDNTLMKAAATLGGSPIYNFFKIQIPLVAPGVISGALFAFITSFDEIVIILFIGGPDQHTLPWQMWSGVREEISPTILAAATILVLLSIVLLTTLELLRRRSERLRGISPA